ncbi:hypothetical protein OHO27_27080 [Streptomyces sp. NBC_00443]
MPEQGTGLQVGNGGEIAVHPGVGGGLRVGLGPQAHQVHRGVHLGADDLEHLTVVTEPGPQRVGLGHRTDDGSAQHLDVEGNGVEVNGALVERALRFQPLSHPHAELSGGDRQADIVTNLGKCQPTHAPRTVYRCGPQRRRRPRDGVTLRAEDPDAAYLAPIGGGTLPGILDGALRREGVRGNAGSVDRP